MDQELLKKLQQAYRDLALTPLIEREDIVNFRVDYGLDIIVRLKKKLRRLPKMKNLCLRDIQAVGNRRF
jgi:hypothetical protein